MIVPSILSYHKFLSHQFLLTTLSLVRNLSIKCVPYTLSFLLHLEGFELRKLKSNCSKLLKNVSLEHRPPLDFYNEDKCFKRLEIMWDSKSGFKFHISLFSGIKSKGSILSYIVTIYHPLSLLSPVVILLEVIPSTQLWLLKFKWEVMLSHDFCECWLTFTSKFHFLTFFNIPCYIGNVDENSKLIEICDAKEKVFSHVLLNHSINGFTRTSLFVFKTKVIPLISHLLFELCRTMLLSK